MRSSETSQCGLAKTFFMRSAISAFALDLLFSDDLLKASRAGRTGTSCLTICTRLCQTVSRQRKDYGLDHQDVVASVSSLYLHIRSVLSSLVISTNAAPAWLAPINEVCRSESHGEHIFPQT